MNGKRLDVFGTKRAERYAHGTHARYALGPCRCFPCKLANSEYEAKRYPRMKRVWHCRIINARGRLKGQYYVINGETKEIVFRSFDHDAALAECKRLNKRDVKPRAQRPSQLVPIGKVRRHLLELQGAGVGLKRIAKASGVMYSTLCRMVGGARYRPIRRTRRSTAERILAVKATAIAGGARVEAGPTLELLDRLIRAGYRKFWIAKQLGARSKTGGRPPLQIDGRNGFVSVRNARKVFELYLRLQQHSFKLPKIPPVFILPAAESAMRRNGKAAA